MKIWDLLIGRKVRVMTDMKVEVELVIKSINENKHSEDLEPATAANDWWPASRDWKNYSVKFENGATKVYDNLDQINLI